jgi:chromosomal replication initiation ATPase DnaA
MHGNEQPQDTNAQSGRIPGPTIRRHEHHLLLLAVEPVVAQRLGVSFDLIYGHVRGPEAVVFARQLSLYLAQTVGALTLSEAAALFGRSPGAVAHALKHIDDRRDVGDAFDRAVGLLQADVSRTLENYRARWRLGV